MKWFTLSKISSATVVLLAIALVVMTMTLTGARAGDQDQAAKTEQLLVRAQKICPVSGHDLMSMGGPVKANSGGRTLFLCCKGCLGKPISAENWAKVQANLIAAQRKCPVLGKALPKDAKSTVVKGRTVFVCCPPCIQKITADPEKYLTVVNDLLKTNLKDKHEQK